MMYEAVAYWGEDAFSPKHGWRRLDTIRAAATGMADLFSHAAAPANQAQEAATAH